ncbi:MAG: 2-oxoglutarate dehydrogenase E1 component [Myxococcales bacterium]|nr:2-oxoglutarate dehydrogenase E1 component [Myxococcales bacterium]
MFEEFGINAGFVEELHARYQQSPQSVDEQWRSFFAEQRRAGGTHETHGDTGGHAARMDQASVARPATPAPRPTITATGPVVPPQRLLDAAALQGRVYELVNAYRVRGHMHAHLDPLGPPPEPGDEFNLSRFDLHASQLDEMFPTVGISGLPPHATLRTIVAHMRETYSSSIGVEFTHIENATQRLWLEEKMESCKNRPVLDHGEVLRILTKLTDAENLEHFVHQNFVGAKRFSLEGAESMIAMLDLLVEEAGKHDVDEIVLGMAHRGRLNVLVNVMGKPPRELFAAFRDNRPERFVGGGDVKYHLGHSIDRVTASGHTIHLTLAFNPSHLEFVNPVVEGRVRAKQDRRKRNGVMPLLIHGDAAFIGQGIVPETLNLAGLEGYATHGTVHLVVNNQIGFTTLPSDSRSTRYCTDIARMMRVPVFHVNGEDPEAVIHVARLAIEYRQRFGEDVVIDMYCYRRYGHNEADEPRFTQPTMYATIDKKPTIREVYVRRLLRSGHIDEGRAGALQVERKAALEFALEEEKQGDYNQPPPAMGGVWEGYAGGANADTPEVPTQVSREHLGALAATLAEVPAGFNPNPKVLKLIEGRRDKVAAGQAFDWGTAEHLAFGTLVQEGFRVRLSGQDARRGTFTHRHAVLFDAANGARHTPLASLPGAAPFEVWDSPLSEAGVLGFEYGYSLDFPDALVLWEAQFGDFANGAQVIIDQFIISGEDKWKRLSGLVLLLPHGYEGQGPEHSSARVERFLTLAAQDNIQVMNLTTPAQLFHALRRQVKRKWRKPLVIFTPKSLLRHPKAVSTVDDLADGEFRKVLVEANPTIQPSAVKRVLLCSGKVYYDLVDARDAAGRTDVAILRLEQLYPLDASLPEALAPYADGTPLVWVQEEPRNAGAWYFLCANLTGAVGNRLPLSSVTRAASASPATGSTASHKLEQKRLMEEALG